MSKFVKKPKEENTKKNVNVFSTWFYTIDNDWQNGWYTSKKEKKIGGSSTFIYIKKILYKKIDINYIL
jgi:hypothetical protein